MSRWERAAARLHVGRGRPTTTRSTRTRTDVRVGRLVPSAELLIAIGIVLVFFGGFAAFIAALALTR